MAMKLTKTITGSAGGFVFSLQNIPDRPDEFLLRIDDAECPEHYLNLGAKKEKIEEFLAGCCQMLAKLRTFQPETP